MRHRLPAPGTSPPAPTHRPSVGRRGPKMRGIFWKKEKLLANSAVKDHESTTKLEHCILLLCIVPPPAPTPGRKPSKSGFLPGVVPFYVAAVRTSEELQAPVTSPPGSSQPPVRSAPPGSAPATAVRPVGPTAPTYRAPRITLFRWCLSVRSLSPRCAPHPLSPWASL